MRRWLIPVLGLAFFLVASLATEQAQGQTVHKLGYSGSGIGADDLIQVMLKEKLWQKHGFDITPVYFNSGSLLGQALLAGEIQSSESDVPTMLNLAVSGALDIKLIAVTFNRLEHSFLVNKAIKTPEDLKGKKIAISRFGSASDVTTRLVLRFWKLNPEKDLAILQSGNTPTRLASLAAGHVDGALINPAYVHRVLASGCCRVLADLSDLPMDYARTGQVVPAGLLRTHRQTLKRYLEAIIEGIHAYKTKPRVVLQVYAEQGLKDPEAAKQIYERISRSLREYPVPEPQGVQAVLDSLSHPKARGAKAADFFDSSLLEEIKASGFIDRVYGRK
ncbi:MAG: ABC transporter substrate-binding protein [Deltaproteobacteria bacterium]|nr:ABC transporter substrate-binding protein [Deltaproteobacteria bacterium]